MFAANVLTVWVEAFKALFDGAYPIEEWRDLPVNVEYPLAEVNYPGLWLNFTVQGDVKNVGIGHVEYTVNDALEIHEVYRWHFGGLIEITITTLGNLERARLVDEVTKAIAIARARQNTPGILRETVENNDLLGMIVTWESMSVSGFAETAGTPWGTSDVVYEVTVSLDLEGEVVLDPATGALVPLTAVILTPQDDSDADPLPVPGADGWV